MRSKTRKYQKHDKLTFKKHNYTKKQKTKIANALFSLTKEDALTDFCKLQNIGCSSRSTFGKTGNAFVNYFTLEERLETIGNKKVNFYDVWKNRHWIAKHYPYVQKILDYYDTHYATYPQIKIWKRIFDLYYGSITIFRPLQAMDIYCQFQPRAILDFTMGWGGRLVGACALQIPHYIGIDSNVHLRTPYQKMVRLLKTISPTKISLLFQDALTVDYSRLTYDMVFTSPPYYNIEIYGHHQDNHNNALPSKEIWDTKFYKPIFHKTYTHLQRGGVYCLNIPDTIYRGVAMQVLGACHMKIPMNKFSRTIAKHYDEYIYIWKKK